MQRDPWNTDELNFPSNRDPSAIEKGPVSPKSSDTPLCHDKPNGAGSERVLKRHPEQDFGSMHCSPGLEVSHFIQESFEKRAKFDHAGGGQASSKSGTEENCRDSQSRGSYPMGGGDDSDSSAALNAPAQKQVLRNIGILIEI